MKLSPEEEVFLEHWMYDERHFTDKSLAHPAKKLQRDSLVTPANLARIIAAWMPDPEEQARWYEGPPPEEPPEWPWTSREAFQARLDEARDVLAARNRGRDETQRGKPPSPEEEPARA